MAGAIRGQHAPVRFYHAVRCWPTAIVIRSLASCSLFAFLISHFSVLCSLFSVCCLLCRSKPPRRAVFRACPLSPIACSTDRLFVRSPAVCSLVRTQPVRLCTNNSPDVTPRQVAGAIRYSFSGIYCRRIRGCSTASVPFIEAKSVMQQRFMFP
jgi:hypothetical protein